MGVDKTAPAVGLAANFVESLMKSVIFISIAAAGLAACAEKTESQSTAQSENTAVAEIETTGTDEADVAADSCPVYDSRNWGAWLDVMPGPNATPKLHITGEVDLPTPGYTAQWTAGPADRANPPAQHFDLSFTPPDGMVTQVITPMAVKYEGDAAYASYRAIIVSCGDEVLAEITDIGEVQ